MIDQTPRVSIIIPVYNGANYLKEAIDSAINQTYKNTEIIVVNDGSTDNGKTAAICRSYGSKIRYIEKPNGGVSSALNTGIKNMKGELFCWLSHDDVYYPQKTSIQVDFLKSNDTILYGDFDIMDANSRFSYSVKITDTDPKNFLYKLITSYPVSGCTVMVHKRCFEECRVFDENLKTTQDYDLWFKFARKFKFVHIPEPLIKSRHHSKQGTAVLKSVHLKECNKLYAKFLKNTTSEEIAASSGSEDSIAYIKIAHSFLGRGYLKAAYISFVKSIEKTSGKNLFVIIRMLFLFLESFLMIIRMILVRYILPYRVKIFIKKLFRSY